MAETAGRQPAKDALFDAFGSIARALSSGRRGQIIEVLAQGERSVEEIADAIGQSMANTSHHLRALAAAGLVASRRSGTYVHYRLASGDVLELWWALRRVAAAQVDDFDARAAGYLGDRTEVPMITREELLGRLDDDEVLVLDMRPGPEYAAGHLPGAVNVPPDRLDLLDDLPEGRDVVAYCRGPYCVYADDAVRRLRRRGRRAVRLVEGLPEWRHAGGPVKPEAGHDPPPPGEGSA